MLEVMKILKQAGGGDNIRPTSWQPTLYRKPAAAD
jgi:hypothetical protein